MTCEPAMTIRTCADPLITGWADPAVGLAVPTPTTPRAVQVAVRQVTVVLTEVLTGARPIAQIARWMDPTEHACLTRWRVEHPHLAINQVHVRTRHPAVSQALAQISWQTSAGQLSAVAELAVTDTVRCRRIVVLFD